MRIHLMLIFASLFTVSACSNPETEKVVQREFDNSKSDDVEMEKLPRMIAIHASYCSVCKEMKPIVEKIKSQCDRDHVRIETYDVSIEQNEHYLDEFNVRGLPTYIFIDEAEYEVARLVGAQSESALKQALGVLRGEDCPGVGKLRNQKNS